MYKKGVQDLLKPSSRDISSPGEWIYLRRLQPLYAPAADYLKSGLKLFNNYLRGLSLNVAIARFIYSGRI